MSLYAQMAPEELKDEMDKLQRLGQIAYDKEDWGMYNVYMTKWYLAKSFEMLPTADIVIGKTYRIADDYDRLTITHMEGAMAWGIRESTAEKDSVPIARLDEFDDGFDWREKEKEE